MKCELKIQKSSELETLHYNYHFCMGEEFQVPTPQKEIRCLLYAEASPFYIFPLSFVWF